MNAPLAWYFADVNELADGSGIYLRFGTTAQHPVIGNTPFLLERLAPGLSIKGADSLLALAAAERALEARGYARTGPWQIGGTDSAWFASFDHIDIQGNEHTDLAIPANWTEWFGLERESPTDATRSAVAS